MINLSLKGGSALLVLSATLACAPKHRVEVVVPKECIRVALKDFTKPCKQMASGHLLCDGVEIQADCVRAK
jgi:hypothetical protein